MRCYYDNITGSKMSAPSAASGILPDISSTKTSLVEVTRSSHTHSPPACASLAGCSELHAPSTAPTTLLTRRASSPQARAATAPPQYVPRPPSTSPRESTTARPRKVLEYVRLSRSELDHKDRAITALRSENVQLQATVRELRSMQDSHAALQSACADVARCLGCTVEGVAAESVRDVLYNQASSVLQDRQQAQEQLRGSQVELERSKCETATANVKVSSLESQLQQARAALVTRDTELQGMKSEVERLQQSEARNSTVLQTLRQRLTETEGERRGEQRLTELHTEIGRLKRALNEKDESLQGVRGELEASQAEKEELKERVTSLEEMYEDLCAELVTALRLEETDTHDIHSLIAEVGRLSQECPELKLRTDTLAKTLKACELDSRASRETILRLVSEAKKQQRLAAQLSELQQAREEQEALLDHLEKERDSYQERLVAAKETMAAQEEEMQAKDVRIRELVSSWQSLKATSDAESELITSEQQKYEELCKAVGSLIGSASSDTVELLQALEQVVQSHQQLRERLEEREGEEEVEGGKVCNSLQGRLNEVEEELESERSKVKQLEGELITTAVVKEGMERNAEKEQEFYQRLSKAMKLDSTTARVLMGDFARDAILTRAEQLAKHETQALAERQSAFYAAQRQLKTCRQTLSSKELYLSLLQKKTASLEERVQEMTQRESQLENMAGKSVKLEKQVERLKSKMAQQTEEMERLRNENAKMASLQTHCGKQESEIKRLSDRLEQLNQARSDQAQQLAEARVRAQNAASKERREDEGMKEEIRHLQAQLSQAGEVEQKFGTFKAAVKKLLSSSRGDGAMEEGKGETPSDYDLMAQLEQLVADHKELRDMVKCLGSSLQQLEQGFKTGYSDTLTILQTKA